MSGKHAPLQVQSRFAVLEEVSDDESEDEEAKPIQGAEKKTNAAKNAKKKARKKKKAAAESHVISELRQMAFSKPVSAKVVQDAHLSRHPVAIPNSAPPSITKNASLEPVKVVESEDVFSWDEWKEKDEQFVVDQFQKDLEVALRLSEADNQVAKKNVAENSSKKKKNKKPKEQVIKMTLDEFSASIPSELSIFGNPPLSQQSVHTHIDAIPVINTGSFRINGHSPEELDPHYYSEQSDVSRKLPEPVGPTAVSVSDSRQKKQKKKPPVSDHQISLTSHTEQSHNGFVLEYTGLDSATVASWKDALEKKDQQIEKLNEIVQAQQDELAQVKKRNKQLCFILGQGEMKDKSEILLQIEELTSVKDELSAELTELHSSLEQERSKVSALKQELAKYQTARHKSKSVSEEK